MTKRKTIVSLIINLIIFTVTAGVVTSYFFGNTGGAFTYGYECFRYFTTDSNILTAIAALITAICEIRVLSGKAEKIPKFALVLKHMGAVSLTLTFCTVMALLMPFYGPEMMIGGTAFHMHVGAPIMSVISVMFLETEYRLSIKDKLTALIPAAVYGAVYFTEVILITKVNGGWDDFYKFNLNGMWFVTVPVMLGFTFVLSLLIGWVHNKQIRN